MLRRNVLIFHAGALGDFVVTWPLALALGRLHPQSRIIYVTPGQKGKLAEKALRTESLDADTGWHALFSPDASTLPDPQRKALQNAHSIFSFVASPGDAWSNNVRAIAPESQLLHLTPRPADADPFPGHVTDWIATQLAPAPAAKTAFDQIMRSVASRGVGFKRSPEGVICVHPGGGSEKKRWPSHHFVQLVRKLVKSRHHVRVLIGEVEREQLPKDDLVHFASIGELAEPTTYTDLLDHLGRADALICNDTGPGHLAGVIGTPTFALFGPHSNLARWRPVGPHVHTKQTTDLPHLPADDVHQWVTSHL